jgi:serine/threonine-protein kinase
MFERHEATEASVESNGHAAGPSALTEALGASYALERELGRGGMATIYLARDLRHRRAVAVKVLHAELSALLGAERFLKEIELTASLQHAHILPLFDSGTAGGLLYYVMPYVAGESLRARLERERQLPVEDSLRLAREVADALAYAHARGVVHRDVKPENILLQNGHALVADFGIALAVEQAGGQRMTQTGMSLGTPQYMAPEQAMGERRVDARVDVYALGAVLYEMLAGEPPFTGPTAQSIVAKVMTDEPKALTLVRRSVPPHVDAAVLRALEKLPADRFATAAAFADALATENGPVTPGRTARRRDPMPRRMMAMLGAGGLIVAAALGLVYGWTRGHASAISSIGAARGPVRFTIEPDSVTPEFGSLAISPDGRTVVYAGYAADGGRLYMRRLDDVIAHPLPGTEDGDQPFFSPDGRWVGYIGNGALRKVRLDGGAPVVVSPVPPTTAFAGASWGTDDVILYSTNERLFRIAATGGTAWKIAVADSTVMLIQPHLLPGGRSALVTVTKDMNAGRLGVVELATGRLRQFGPAAGARYARGHIVFAGLGGELYRQPFDLDRMEPSGTAEQIASGLDAANIALPQGASTFDISPADVLVFRAASSASGEGTLRLIVTDRTGRELTAIQARAPWTPRFSPDARHVVYGAFPRGRDSSDLWITNLESGRTQRLTADVNDSNDPQWSPDGRAVAFSANDVTATSEKDMFVKPIGGGPARRFARPGIQWPSAWTKDGRTLLFTEWHLGERDIWLQPMDSSPARPYLATSAREQGGVLSPDGRWVAYVSDESGRDAVYVQSFPKPGIRTLISEAGTNPVWGGEGLELYYWEDNQLIEARPKVEGLGEALSLGATTRLFQAPYYSKNPHAMYDVSRDGTKFIIVTGGSRAGRLVVALGVLGRDEAARPGGR